MNENSEIQDVELAVSRWLRIGVIISAAVIILGLILLFIQGGSGYPGDTYPHDLPDIFRGLIELKLCRDHGGIDAADPYAGAAGRDFDLGFCPGRR
ncbi:hypothetical protein CM49_02924 [Paenibacillus sp. P1XP2]|nr:hypothetical protein CM49_02924 [Paenibacillus sp. P1XP2]